METRLKTLAICAGVAVAFGGLAAFTSPADDVVTRQDVMLGPFPDGRIVWCKGHQDDDGNLVIAAADAGTCRMDTSDVAAAAARGHR